MYLQRYQNKKPRTKGIKDYNSQNGNNSINKKDHSLDGKTQRECN